MGPKFHDNGVHAYYGEGVNEREVIEVNYQLTKFAQVVVYSYILLF